MRLDELRRLSILLDAAAGPRDVFMALRDPGLRGDARGPALADELRRLQALANPERFMGNPSAQDLARELRARLQGLHDAGLATLVDAAAPAILVPPAETRPVDPPFTEPTVSAAPAYTAADQSPEPPGSFVVVVGANHYHFTTPVCAGDIASIRRGRCVAGARAGLEVAAKVAIERSDNSFILAEIQALRMLARGAAGQRGQVPELLDLFHGPEGHAGVVLPWLTGIDGQTLRARFADGLPPEHVIWIGRRLLAVAGHAHKLGVVHANIEPAHIVVRPHDHHVTLIDWCYSVLEPARSGQGFRVYNPDYSAPEVLEKRSPLPAADLYSIGRCLLFLLGGDLASGALPDRVDDRLQRFVRYLTRTSPLQRAQDAWEMFEELERTRTAMFGPHTFCEFVVP